MVNNNLNNTSESTEPDEETHTNIYNGGSGDDGDDNPEGIHTSDVYFNWLFLLFAVLVFLNQFILRLYNGHARFVLPQAEKVHADKMLDASLGDHELLCIPKTKDNLPSIDANRIRGRLLQAAAIRAENTWRIMVAIKSCPDWMRKLVHFLLQLHAFARFFL